MPWAGGKPLCEREPSLAPPPASPPRPSVPPSLLPSSPRLPPPQTAASPDGLRAELRGQTLKPRCLWGCAAERGCSCRHLPPPSPWRCRPPRGRPAPLPATAEAAGAAAAAEGGRAAGAPPCGSRAGARRRQAGAGRRPGGALPPPEWARRGTAARGAGSHGLLQRPVHAGGRVRRAAGEWRRGRPAEDGGRREGRRGWWGGSPAAPSGGSGRGRVGKAAAALWARKGRGCRDGRTGTSEAAGWEIGAVLQVVWRGLCQGDCGGRTAELINSGSSSKRRAKLVPGFL